MVDMPKVYDAANDVVSPAGVLEVKEAADIEEAVLSSHNHSRHDVAHPTSTLCRYEPIHAVPTWALRPSWVFYPWTRSKGVTVPSTRVEVLFFSHTTK